jgi:hypothetical protein
MVTFMNLAIPIRRLLVMCRWCLLLAVLGAIIAYIVMTRPLPIREKAKTVSTLLLFHNVLIAYHREYHAFPSECMNAVDLIKVLSGKSVNGQNPKGIVFLSSFENELKLKEKIIDGWGRPFIVLHHKDATNIIIRSYGRNGFDDGGDGDDYEINTANFYNNN